MPARVTTAFIAVVVAGLRSSSDAMAAEPSQPTDPASPAHRFGERGEVVISGATQASLAYSASNHRGLSRASAFVSAAGDVFVMHRLSLGARFDFDHYAPDGQPTYEGVSIGPRVGYNVTLSDCWSVWPDVFASYGAGWSEGGPIETHTVSVGVFAPVLYHPVPHFFLGLGPMVSTVVQWGQYGFERIQTTEISLAANVGGWMGR